MPGGAFGLGIHHLWRSFSIRDRLDREYGDHKSSAIWRFGRGLLPTAALTVESFLAMASSPRQVAGGSTRRNWGG